MILVDGEAEDELSYQHKLKWGLNHPSPSTSIITVNMHVISHKW